ncbi:MAG TPA: hypothetical protein DCM54_02425 [Gammaproteobacteria bacterium]|nr:hypothetical protein [Gammaproteobacteria bacterium]
MMDDINILQAADGCEAMDILEDVTVNVMVTDMRMPEVDGCELLQYAAQHAPRTRRIVLTGYARLEQTIDAINRGNVHRYLTKPWDNDDLRDVVSEELRKSESEPAPADEILEMQRQIEELNRKIQLTSGALSASTALLREVDSANDPE